MAAPSPGYTITVRVEAPTAIDTTGVIAAAVASAGGALTVPWTSFHGTKAPPVPRARVG